MTAAGSPPIAGHRPPAEPTPLSLNQHFLRAFDQGPDAGAFSDRHTLTNGWRITGPVDEGTLRRALADVVRRHEALRTVILRGDGLGGQVVQPPSDPELEVRDLTGTPPPERDARAEELVNECDAAPYPVDRLPHLRAVLGRFDGTDAVLALITHHVSTDAWSMQVLMEDVAACYAIRRGHARELPEALPYREFAAAQSAADPEAVGAARDYWREKLRGARILALPVDRARVDGEPAEYAAYRFVFGDDLGARLQRYAGARRSSGFMVLLAAYLQVLRARTGVTDIVVPTFTSGRYEEPFQRTVGPFFNFLPLRVYLAGCDSVDDVLARARRTCLEAYAHDIPFPIVAGDCPDVIAPFGDPGLAVFAFELLQSAAAMDGAVVGDLSITEIRRRERSQPVASAIPNGGLWALDFLPTGELAGSLKVNLRHYDPETALALIDDLHRALTAVVADRTGGRA